MSRRIDLRWALDPVAFAREALSFVPDPWQQKALGTKARRCIWLCSRQVGKSTTAAILGLHAAIYQPRALVLLASPSLRQSTELFRKVQSLMAMMDRPPPLREDTKTSCELLTGSRIVCLPASESTVRGYSGVSLLVEDESARVPDAFHNACKPMLAVSGGRHVLLSSAFGKRGHFYDCWDLERPGWERIFITAAECPRISQEFLDSELAEVGIWWFSQEYQNKFNDMLDSFFISETIENAFSDEVRPLFADMGFSSFLAKQQKEGQDV